MPPIVAGADATPHLCLHCNTPLPLVVGLPSTDRSALGGEPQHGEALSATLNAQVAVNGRNAAEGAWCDGRHHLAHRRGRGRGATIVFEEWRRTPASRHGPNGEARIGGYGTPSEAGGHSGSGEGGDSGVAATVGRGIGLRTEASDASCRR